MSQVIDKIAWIHIQDRKILTTLSKGKSVYFIPGGKREGEETDHETLAREVKEELEVEIQLDTVEFFGVFKAQSDGAAEGVLVRMTCYTAEYKGDLKASSEIEKIDRFTSADKSRVSAVDKIIYDSLKNRGLID